MLVRSLSKNAIYTLQISGRPNLNFVSYRKMGVENWAVGQFWDSSKIVFAFQGNWPYLAEI